MPKIVERSVKLRSAGGTSTAMFSLGEIISVPQSFQKTIYYCSG